MTDFGYLEIAAVCNVTVYLCTYFPISIYSIVQINKYKKEMFFQKRYTMITVSLCIFFLIFPICTAFYIGTLIFAPSNTLLISFSLSTVWTSLWFLFYALLCKNWMRYFNYKWTYFTLKQKWHSIIAPQKHSNWFLSHKHNYGNFRFITKCIAVIYLILGIISILITFISYYTDHTYLGILGPVMLMEIFAVIPICCVVFKTYYKNLNYYFSDIFSIGWESKMQLLSMLGMAINGFIATIFISIFGLKIAPYVVVSGIVLFNGLCIEIMCWCSTIKVIQKNTVYKYHQYASPSNLIHSVVSDSDHSQSHYKPIKLRKILQDKSAIKIFFQHLSREFSVELLCSYIEFHQFQDYLIYKFNIDKFEMIHLIQLPTNLIISTIISDDDSKIDNVEINDENEILRAKYKAYQLYNKYILIGSKHEINISAEEREKLDTFFFSNDWEMFKNFDNILETDLLILFENCKDEMIKLMKYSIDRFAFNDEQCNDYKMLLQVFDQ